MYFSLLVVFCCFLSINGQLEEAHPAPEPYAFAFSSPNEDGTSSSREETGDANGRITGSYTILGADGQQRRVEYIADENGFRAKVITNEIGTESQSSADAQIESSAPTAAELTAQWEASGAGRAQLHGVAPALIAPAARAPIVAVPFRRPALIATPVAPIGGGVAGAQGLRIGSGIRIGGAVAAPLLRHSAIRVAAPLPAAPLHAPAFGAVRIAAPVATPLISRAQVVETQGYGQLNGGLGFIGTGVAPVGLQVQPIGVNFGLSGPYSSVQKLQTLRGVQNFQGLRPGGVIPLNAGGISEQKLLETESVRNEGYGRKSK